MKMVAIDRRKPDAGEIKELRNRLTQYIENQGNGEDKVYSIDLTLVHCNAGSVESIRKFFIC